MNDSPDESRQSHKERTVSKIKTALTITSGIYIAANVAWGYWFIKTMKEQG